jgi:hypothetical protein
MYPAIVQAICLESAPHFLRHIFARMLPYELAKVDQKLLWKAE